MFDEFKYDIHVLRTRTLPAQIENNQINEIIRKYLLLFSNENKFQCLLRYISQLLMHFQIQSNRLSTYRYPDQEQTVPSLTKSLNKFGQFSFESSTRNYSPLKKENMQIIRSIDKVDCAYIIENKYNPVRIMPSPITYVLKQTKDSFEINRQLKKKTREINVLETICKIILRKSKLSRNNLPSFYERVIRGLINKKQFQRLMFVSKKLYMQKTWDRCSSAYISKRQRKSQRNHRLDICYRRFPLFRNVQKECINQIKTSIDVRKVICNVVENETDALISSLGTNRRNINLSSSDPNLSTANVPMIHKQSNTKFIGQILVPCELYSCVLYQSPWQITTIISHMVSACIRISLDCRLRASILRIECFCSALSESETDYYWKYGASINMICANEDNKIGHKDKSKSHENRSTQVNNVVEELHTTTNNTENENIVFHLENSLKIDDQNLIEAIVDENYSRFDSDSYSTIQNKEINNTSDLVESISLKSIGKHSRIMKIDSISKPSKTSRIMIIPRKSIDDSDIGSLSIRTTTVTKNITKQKTKFNRFIRRTPTSSYRQLKDPCRILDFYAQFRCPSLFIKNARLCNVYLISKSIK